MQLPDTVATFSATARWYYTSGWLIAPSFAADFRRDIDGLAALRRNKWT